MTGVEAAFWLALVVLVIYAVWALSDLIFEAISNPETQVWLALAVGATTSALAWFAVWATAVLGER